MPKKRLDDIQKPDSVEDVLAKIAKFDERKPVDTNLASEPDSIYFYNLRRDDSTFNIFLQLHGKCAEKALANYQGYTTIITGHVKSNNYDYSRTKCESCGEQLNPRLAKKLSIEHQQRREARKQEAIRLAAIQLEKDKELALLGLL